MKPPLLITTRAVSRRTRLTALLRGGVGLGALLVVMPLTADAGPTGGTVVQGTATIAATTATQPEVSQTTARAVIDWTGFNLASNESMIFKQPSAASVTLNRVTAGTGTVIAGQRPAV
ncbi:hypothetical protein CHU95_10835 [Niveispirillum lacus]|uniref:Filamentous haemagglutinin FhaB/tRNA nuclease CdiA-like TPS domain-containing protein n=1 Tax=Niveispirillum lacus TaxID=1981099 RepID=A0A255YZA7_9PROT|nr:hypothetical protein [Niveispirillum lacus]OYQ34511.1 hypothetical protein CHU95_10835 [Niveispirillum lacus]